MQYFELLSYLSFISFCAVSAKLSKQSIKKREKKAQLVHFERLDGSRVVLLSEEFVIRHLGEFLLFWIIIQILEFFLIYLFISYIYLYLYILHLDNLVNVFAFTVRKNRLYNLNYSSFSTKNFLSSWKYYFSVDSPLRSILEGIRRTISVILFKSGNHLQTHETFPK